MIKTIQSPKFLKEYPLYKHVKRDFIKRIYNN